LVEKLPLIKIEGVPEKHEERISNSCDLTRPSRVFSQARRKGEIPGAFEVFREKSTVAKGNRQIPFP
jgi:hypothetical protein